MLRAAWAAALVALDMIRTGPLAGAGDDEAEELEAAEVGVWATDEAVERGPLAAFMSSVDSSVRAGKASLGTGFSKVTSDTFETSDIMEGDVEA